ncbi:MAG TPA: transposase family protein [Candidatus Limnocylindrales bacterium]|nr:transposase family protein [Candidatus Limnocylindrales bacterium]
MEIDVSEWINLYNKYCHNYSSSENDRKFASLTGTVPQVAETIFLKYGNHILLQNRTRLLIVLNFLKNSPTEDQGASLFELSRTTYRKYLWDTLLYLDFIMDEVHMKDRFMPFVPENGLFENVTLVVDATECAIDRPTRREDRNLYSNGRHKENTHGRYNLKYTVGVQVATGKICFVSNPEPGSVADIQALVNSDLVDYMTPGEIILADKGYQGHPNCLSPFKGTNLDATEEAFNEIIASVRQVVECVFSRMKIFGIIGKGRYRWDLSNHRAVFNVCAQITNISLDRSPLWLETNFYMK